MDGLGNPTHLHLTAGNVHDVVEAAKLIEASAGKNFIADKAYDANDVIGAAEAKGMNAVIPPRSNRTNPHKIDFHIYRERHLIENFFCKIKQFRRVATRYEKTATNYLGFVVIASIKIWLA